MDFFRFSDKKRVKDLRLNRVNHQNTFQKGTELLNHDDKQGSYD